MKTTVELPDDLLKRTRRLAQRDGTSLKTLMEEGLRLALKQRERPAANSFSFPVYGQGGLREEFQGAGWERIRDEIYRDRG